VTDDKAQAFISGVVEEAKQYRSAMVIFDLDSLADVTKSYSSLTKSSAKEILRSGRRATAGDSDSDDEEDDDANFTYNVAHPNVLSTALREAWGTPTPNKPFWVVVLSEDLYLTSRFKQMFTRDQWPFDEKDRRAAERKAEQKRKEYAGGAGSSTPTWTTKSAHVTNTNCNFRSCLKRESALLLALSSLHIFSAKR